jgi:hypothetical protein
MPGNFGLPALLDPISIPPRASQNSLATGFTEKFLVHECVITTSTGRIVFRKACRLSRAEARRIAVNTAKLPELLQKAGANSDAKTYLR